MRSARTGSARRSSSSRSAAAGGRAVRRERSGTTCAPSRSARSASEACAGSASSGSTCTRRTGPTGRRAPQLEESWGTMAALVDEGKVRWIGVSNFDVEQLERCEAVRHVDSVQPPLSLLVRGALSDRGAVGAGARRRRARLLAARVRDAHGRLRPRADRGARRGRLAPRRARVPGAAPLAEPRARRAARTGRRPARDDDSARSRSHGCWRSPASPRVSSGRACRLTSTVGWPPPRSRWTTETLREIDEAIAATGAGSDVPPAPPPHIRPPVPDRT